MSIDSIPQNSTAQTDEIEIELYATDDGGIMDAWADLYGDDWLYVTGSEIWLHRAADNTHWADCKVMVIERQIKNVMIAMRSQAQSRLADALRATKAGTDDDRADAKNQVKIHRAQAAAFKPSKNKLSSVEYLARLDRVVNAADLNQGEYLNHQNGTFDIEANALLPHSKDHNFTYVLPYDYDPTARCPRFEAYLDQVLIDPNTDQTDHELVQLVIQYLGYSLTSDTRQHKMLWLSGMGANGKSVLIEVMKKLLGPMACSVDFGVLGAQGNYDAADILGKRVIFSTEAAKGTRLNEDLIKKIVSGETIRSRPIYGKPIEFESTSKIIWAMNDRPIVTDTSNAVWRRMILVPFERTFSEDEQDKDLDSALEKELSGILNLALTGLGLLQKNGFVESSAVAAAIAEYRHESNPVEQWLSECTETDTEPKTASNMAYLHYSAWAANNGRKTVNSTNFGKELARLKAKRKRTNKGNFYFFSITENTGNE